MKAEDLGLIRQATTDYKAFLKGEYTGEDGRCDYEKMSRDYNRKITNENEIPAYSSFPADPEKYTDKAREDYRKIVASSQFASMIRVDSPENTRSNGRNLR